jgi:hypothetical protein
MTFPHFGTMAGSAKASLSKDYTSKSTRHAATTWNSTPVDEFLASGRMDDRPGKRCQESLACVNGRPQIQQPIPLLPPSRRFASHLQPSKRYQILSSSCNFLLLSAQSCVPLVTTGISFQSRPISIPIQQSTSSLTLLNRFISIRAQGTSPYQQFFQQLLRILLVHGEKLFFAARAIYRRMPLVRSRSYLKLTQSHRIHF